MILYASEIPAGADNNAPACKLLDHFIAGARCNINHHEICGLELKAALRVPTFAVAGMESYKRLTLVVDDARIVKAFYPVFPPDRNAADVLKWLRGRATRAPGRAGAGARL